MDFSKYSDIELNKYLDDLLKKHLNIKDKIVELSNDIDDKLKLLDNIEALYSDIINELNKRKWVDSKNQ